MNYKQFCFSYLLMLPILGLVLVPFYLFLINSFEHQSYEDIVVEQIKNNAIYGTALNQNTFLYKYELVKKIKPKVIAIGSSKVMKFRKEFFSKSFVNSGGAVNNLYEAKLFLKKILAVHRPEVVFLGVDDKWFNGNIKYPESFPYHLNTGDILTFRKLLSTPISFYLQDKISFDDIKNIIFNTLPKSQFSSYKRMGLDAIINFDGYAPDGSRFDGRRLLGIQKNHDIKLHHTLNELNNGIKNFTYGSKKDFHYENVFEEMLEMLAKNKIKTYIFITPSSPTVGKAFKKKKIDFGYIDVLRQYIINKGGIDFHDFQHISSNDCEFIDGDHGGDITYQRILLYFATKFPEIEGLINQEFLVDNILRFSGSTITILNNEINVDFINEDIMELGCPKIYNKL